MYSLGEEGLSLVRLRQLEIIFDLLPLLDLALFGHFLVLLAFDNEPLDLGLGEVVVERVLGILVLRITPVVGVVGLVGLGIVNGVFV